MRLVTERSLSPGAVTPVSGTPEASHPPQGELLGMDLPWGGVALRAETPITSPLYLWDSIAPTAVLPQTPQPPPIPDPSYLPRLFKALLVCTVNDINLPWGGKGQSVSPPRPPVQPSAFCRGCGAPLGYWVPTRGCRQPPHSPAGLCCPDTSSSMGGWSAAPRYPRHSA